MKEKGVTSVSKGKGWDLLRGRMVSVGICCVFAWVGPAGVYDACAQSPGAENVEELSADGLKQYNAGNYPEAIALYLKAYQIEPVAALLYNIAKIYDTKLNERGLAIQFYRRYMGYTDADPDLVSRAAKRVQELQKQQEAGESPAATAKQAAPSESTQPAEPVSARTRPEGAFQADRGTTPSEGSGTATAGYVVGGIGLAGIAFGSIAGFVAKSKDRDADEHCNANNFCDQTGLDQTNSARTWAGVATGTWIVGGAALATGILMVALASSEDEQPPVALAPTVAPNGGGLAFQGVW